MVAACVKTFLLAAVVAAAGTAPGAPVPVAAAPAIAARPQGVTVATVHGRLPIRFEPNVGQADPSVQYLARGDGFSVGLTGRGAVLALAADQPRRPAGRSRIPADTAFLHIDPVGAVHRPVLRAERRQESVSNYFIGNDRSKWRSNVANYGAVRYQQVYPGIDWVVYGNPDQLEYDLVVSPKADPRRIRFQVGGADSLALDEQGNLLIHAGGHTLSQLKPVLYQVVADGSRRSVAGRYVLDGASFAFAVGDYDHGRALVIDPSFVYSTYLGGSGNDEAHAIATDSNGNAYVAGETASPDFPRASPLQANNKSSSFTAFVAKLNPSGSTLLYSTYLGGSGSDAAFAIAVDGSGNAYIGGQTTSIDFPTVNPVQGTNHGGTDGFVAKLNASGSALVYSTYLGGSAFDSVRAIAVDSGGAAYMTGQTSSGNFPLASPFQSVNGNTNYTAYVAKLNTAGSALVYSTYLGGNVMDQGNGIAVDGTGNAFVAGYTSSSNFPTVSPVQASNAGGGGDAFVAKFNPAGSALLYSTYLGGSGGDRAQALAIDGSGNAYVAGYTTSTDFPTASPLQAAIGGGSTNGDAFVAKLNAAGNALVYSTYLGGSADDSANGIAVDGAGEAYVAGRTLSTDFPVASPLQSTSPGSAGFVARFNAGGSALLYSTYLSGTGAAAAAAVAVDRSNDAYVAGQTDSFDFPTVNPLQRHNAGGTFDGFVTKISNAPVSPPTNLAASPGNGQAALSWTAAGGATSYNIYQGTSPGGEGSTPVMSGVTGTSFNVTSLSNGTQYYFIVKAVNGSGISDPSNEASALPLAPPTAPYGLAASPGNGQATLCWNRPADNVLNNVYRTANSSGASPVLVKGGVNGGCAAITGLSNGSTDYFAVTGTSAGGESPASPVITVGLAPTPTAVPPAITGTSVTPGSSLLDVCWVRNSSAYSYRVYRVTGPAGGSPALQRSVAGGCAIITGLSGGTRYYFQVSGVNTIGEGPLSAVVSGIPLP
jgi:fibronectin type 3 domain-containing protein